MYKILSETEYSILPMPKFLGLFSNRGLTTFFGSAFFTAKGAAATFFPTFFLGYKKRLYIQDSFVE
jgi:hypothetical protein